MAKKEDLMKIILYTIIILPLSLLALEKSLEITSKYRYSSNIDNNESLLFKPVVAPSTIYDPITGWRHNCKDNVSESQSINELLCDRHGLILTPYSSNTKKEVIGILLLGNSVAMGEGLNSKNNKKTFASQLEYQLRNLNKNIDLVNAAYSGFNTWQEHAETMRYLNSYPFHDDLPQIELIVSFGGIQDFWNLIRILSTDNYLDSLKYKNANGLMNNMTNIEYSRKVNSAFTGNKSLAFKSFVSSFISQSYIYNFIKSIKLPYYSTNNITSVNKNHFSLHIKANNSSLDLEQILSKRFSMKMEEYINKRDYFIASVIRNIKSNSRLIEEHDYTYVYAPTYFSTIRGNLEINEIVKGITYLIGRESNNPLEIYEQELSIIEADYRSKLLSELNLIKGIKVLDYSGVADNHTWFIDYSHFNEHAARSISIQLSKDLIKILNDI